MIAVLRCLTAPLFFVIVVLLRCCSVVLEIVMADPKSVATSVDVLTFDERRIVVGALELRIAQIKRSAASEVDPEVVALRTRALAAVEALVLKFR